MVVASELISQRRSTKNKLIEKKYWRIGRNREDQKGKPKLSVKTVNGKMEIRKRVQWLDHGLRRFDILTIDLCSRYSHFICMTICMSLLRF